MKLLLNVNYECTTGKWSEISEIKNKVVSQKRGETIHQTITRTIEDTDNGKVLYGGKPQTKIYCDKKNGEAEVVGYLYRVQLNLQDENYQWKKVNFNAWVDIAKVSKINL